MVYVYADLMAVVLIFIASRFQTKSSFISVAKNQIQFEFRKLIFDLLCILSCSVLTLISALRYYVGTDYESYANRVVTDTLFGTNQKEILFTQIVKIAVKFGSVQWIFVITSVIFVAFVYKYIIDQSKNLSLSVFLFVGTTFYSFSLNAVRQAIATAIFLYAMKYIIKGKPIPYFVCILLAIGFHKMAIIYLPLYFIRNLKIRGTKTIVLITLTSFILFSLKSVIRRFLLMGLSSIPMLSQYTSYFGSNFDNVLKYVSLAFLILNVVITIFIIICSREMILDRSMQLYIWVQLFITLFSGISFSIPAAFRVFYVFIPVQIVLIPNLIKAVKDRMSRGLLTSGIVILYSALFWFFIIYANYNGTLPYNYIRNFW